MPNVATITIDDGKDTPVSHNFKPHGLSNDGVYHYADISSGIAAGFPRLSISHRAPTGSNSRVYRVKLKLTAPVLETVGTNDAGLTPPPTKAYESLCNIEFVLPERSDPANRKDILAFVQNLLNDATVTAMVEDLESVW